MCYNGKTKKLSGYDYEVIRAIEQKLNFRINMTFLFGNEQWGTILPNGSTTAGLDVLRKGNVDIGIGNYFLRLSRWKYFDSTVSYYAIPIALVIPPREIKLSFL
jgi:ABC-type amino acid transport substrate-binding protein